MSLVKVKNKFQIVIPDDVRKKIRINVGDTLEKDYCKLHPDIKLKVDKQLGFLLSDPNYPSLNLHPMQGTKYMGRICRLLSLYF